MNLENPRNSRKLVGAFRIDYDFNFILAHCYSFFSYPVHRQEELGGVRNMASICNLVGISSIGMHCMAGMSVQYRVCKWHDVDA